MLGVPPDVQTVRLAAGRRLAYREFGDLSGAPVLYFHGGLSSCLDVAFAHGAARDRGVRIVAPDRPGVGESFRLMPRQVRDWADDVAALCDHVGLARFSVLGWSAGGPFALACALRLGDRIVRTATVGGMAPIRDKLTVRQLGLAVDRGLFPLSRRAPLLAQLAISNGSLGSDAALQRRLVRGLPSRSDKSVVAAMTPEEAVGPWRAAVRHGARGLVDDYAITGSDWGFALHEVTAPVTVFQGVEDTIVPMAHAEVLAARLGDARLEMVEGAGHFALHVATDRVLDELTR